MKRESVLQKYKKKDMSLRRRQYNILNERLKWLKAEEKEIKTLIPSMKGTKYYNLSEKELEITHWKLREIGAILQVRKQYLNAHN